MKLHRAVGAAAAVLALLTAPGPAAGQSSYFDLIGYTDLKNRLGAATPTGAGVIVTQVEAELTTGSNNYLPDPTAFPGKVITDRTGGGSVSSHATTVGQFFYGGQSIAQGITQINAYRVADPSLTGDWLGSGYLRTGTPQAPLVDTARVQNHSYTGDAPAGDPTSTEILRRLDYAIRRDNTVVVVAVNNGTGSVPALEASGYNSIAVGLSNGNSSSGPTTFDGAGRSKPDIVVPFTETSFGTPVVSAAAALLVQTAAMKSDPTEAAAAGRVETIKAALLSGATTTGLAQQWQRTNNGSFVEPLDRRFGAGQLNINNSHLILSAPKQNGTDLVPDAPTGWDFGTMTAVGQHRRYYFDAPGNVSSSTLTATVTWLRRIPQTGGAFTTATATLSGIELRIYETDANRNLLSQIDSSVSPVDNVQHTRTDLIPLHHYAVDLSLASLPLGQTSEDYGVAWQVVPVPEPGGAVLVAALAGAAAWVRRKTRRSLAPAATERVHCAVA